MTPGIRTSEFKVAVINFVLAVILAWQDQISDPTAAKLSVAGAVAYIISRGLAKYEGRGGSPPPAG